jgi:signal transduction histidine kinase
MTNSATVRVLLVEPDLAAAQLMREAMNRREARFEIRHVNTLAGALAELQLAPADVALVELNLSDEQGLGTLYGLVKEHPALPIVVLTTVADEDLAITAIQERAQDYLIKDSVHYAAVSRSIRYAIERKRIERELCAARQSAQVASTAKSEFLAHMSHELRSPLDTILGYADNLLEPQLTRLEIQSAVETIRRNGLHLMEIVNDILDISKIETPRFEVERIVCSPAQIVADVATMLEVRARAKGLSLAVDWAPGVPATILSDPSRLKQILVNLVSNGIKFTKQGEVRIGVRLVADQSPAGSPKLEITVRDTGVGIAPHKLRILFEAYRPSEAWTARQFGGTGLGLPVSRQLARRLGGDITVESTEGEGASFAVSVETGPLDGVPRQDTFPLHCKSPRRTESGPAPSCSGAFILLAEDGPDNQRLIAHILRKAGASLEIADNGCEAVELALQAARDNRPHDLVLMDMQMPERDGFEAARALRDQGYTQPIIALSAAAASGGRQKCLDAGCNDFATKPIDRGALLGILHKWLPREALAKEVLTAAG